MGYEPKKRYVEGFCLSISLHSNMTHSAIHHSRRIHSSLDTAQVYYLLDNLPCSHFHLSLVFMGYVILSATRTYFNCIRYFTNRGHFIPDQNYQIVQQWNSKE